MSTAAPKPRKARWGTGLAGGAAVIAGMTAGSGQYGIAALIAIPAAAITVLVLRAKWKRYAAGGWVAARRRRKYQGWAGPADVRRAARSAYTLTRRLAPGTSLLVLGTRGRRKQKVAVCRENSALYIGPPGMGKTAALACHAADAPGALFATSTKTELLLDTLHYRAWLGGRTWILNPDGYGNIPTTLAWSPLEGCVSAQVAIRRAGDFTTAAPKNDTNGSSGDYWAGKGAELLAVAFHAAAISGASMYEVREWVRNPFDESLKAAYALPGADWMLAGDYASFLAGHPEYVSSVISTAEAALSWMRDPVMAAAACPPPGEGFSAWDFARSSDSVYLIGEEREYGSFAPYFAALGAEIFEQLKGHAMESPGGRLDAPATFVLDEMPLTCPMPVHQMLAHSRGYLITLTMGIQSFSQLRAKWGEHNGDTIRSATPVEVILGGEKRHSDLEALSAVMDQRDTWADTRDSSGAKSRTPGSEPLLPPGALRVMRKGKAAILMPECKPVLADLPAIWNRPGHQRLDLGKATEILAGQRAVTPARTLPPVAASPVPVLTDSEVPSWPQIANR